jgi:hypothetical protein
MLISKVQTYLSKKKTFKNEKIGIRKCLFKLTFLRGILSLRQVSYWKAAYSSRFFNTMAYFKKTQNHPRKNASGLVSSHAAA